MPLEHNLYTVQGKGHSAPVANITWSRRESRSLQFSSKHQEQNLGVCSAVPTIKKIICEFAVPTIKKRICEFAVPNIKEIICEFAVPNIKKIICEFAVPNIKEIIWEFAVQFLTSRRESNSLQFSF